MDGGCCRSILRIWRACGPLPNQWIGTQRRHPVRQYRPAHGGWLRNHFCGVMGFIWLAWKKRREVGFPGFGRGSWAARCELVCDMLCLVGEFIAELATWR